MAIDTIRPRSRRALLAGALGGLAAHALGRPQAASASSHPLVLGTSNTTSGSTSVARPDGNTRLFFAGPRYGLSVSSDVADGIGVDGIASGDRGIGVQGRTTGLFTQIAVLGDTTVGGTGGGVGIAVQGRAGNGIGVHASATGGYALQCEGRTVFSRSGKVAFTAGQSARTVPVTQIEPDSIVLATIQGNIAGTWVRGVTTSPANDTFTIRLNKPAPSTFKVGWFIVN